MSVQQQEAQSFGVISDILGIVSKTLSAVIHFVHETHANVAFGHLLTWVQAGMDLLTGKHGTLVQLLDDPDDIVGNVLQDVGAPIVRGITEVGLGLNTGYRPGNVVGDPGSYSWSNPPAPTDSHTQWSQGLKTIERMIGFGLALTVGSSALESALKLIGAQRIGTAIHGGLGKATEEIGMPFAIGMFISNLLETAIGPSVEEWVNVQFHPRRLEWPQIKQLLRQHLISDKEYWALLDEAGFGDDDKALLERLDSSQLPVSDLQALWVTGAVDRPYVKARLEHQGFSNDDVEKLMTLYIDKAETQGSTSFRNEVRSAFIQYRITESQFRDLMAQLLTFPQSPPKVNPPQGSGYDYVDGQVQQVIDLEVDAVRFSQQFGHIQTTVTTIQKMYKTGHKTATEAHHDLLQLGYADADASSLIATWGYAPLEGKPPLSSSKILQYAMSGTFTPEQTYRKLIDLGMKAEPALFLARNPDPKAGPWYPPFNKDTIIQAYYDNVSTYDEALSALLRVPLTETEAKLEMQLAFERKSNKMVLSPGDTANARESIAQLYMGGSLHDAETISLLEETGMLLADATIRWAGWYQLRHGQPPPANLPLQ